LAFPFAKPRLAGRGWKARLDETGAGNRVATGTQYWHGAQIPTPAARFNVDDA
jgi:hypothetical protein